MGRFFTNKRVSMAEAYLLVGHGDEELRVPYDQRPQVPEGVVLVTFTECGVPTFLPHTGKLFEKMNTNSELFQRLATDRSEETVKAIEGALGRKIHYYTEGMKYPSLYLSTLSDFHPPPKDGKSYTFYFKSGVYKLPNLHWKPSDQWEVTNTAITHKSTGYVFSPDQRYAPYGHLVEGDKDIDAARKSYEGSVFPDTETREKALRGEIDDRFYIRNIFTKLGRGVYYWGGCRGTMEGVKGKLKKRVETTRAESRGRQETLRKGAKRRRRTYRKRVRG